MGKHSQPELIKLRLESVHITDEALLVKSDFNKKVWVPKSMLTGSSYTLFDNTHPWQVEFSLPVWFATKKGLI